MRLYLCGRRVTQAHIADRTVSTRRVAQVLSAMGCTFEMQRRAIVGYAFPLVIQGCTVGDVSKVVGICSDTLSIRLRAAGFDAWREYQRRRAAPVAGDSGSRVCTGCGETRPLSEYPTREDSMGSELRLVHGARCWDCERARGRKNAKLRRVRTKALGPEAVAASMYGKAGAERRKVWLRVRLACRASAAARRGAARARQRAAARASLRMWGGRRPPRARWDRDLYMPGIPRSVCRKKFGNAVYGGHVKRADRCEKCGCSATGYKINAHHDDYDYPMRVRWLCTTCNVEEHGTEWGGHSLEARLRELKRVGVW